mgnify:CR=1 FL=1
MLKIDLTRAFTPTTFIRQTIRNGTFLGANDRKSAKVSYSKESGATRHSPVNSYIARRSMTRGTIPNVQKQKRN